MDATVSVQSSGCAGHCPTVPSGVVQFIQQVSCACGSRPGNAAQAQSRLLSKGRREDVAEHFLGRQWGVNVKLLPGI